jgi:hypothetical protein
MYENGDEFRDELEPGGDDPEDRARKQFNLATDCDDPDDWMLGDDAMKLHLLTAPERLEQLQERECAFIP